MWIFGAVDFTAALARVAKVLGYRVTGQVAAQRHRLQYEIDYAKAGPRGRSHATGATVDCSRRLNRGSFGRCRGLMRRLESPPAKSA